MCVRVYVNMMGGNPVLREGPTFTHSTIRDKLWPRELNKNE